MEAIKLFKMTLLLLFVGFIALYVSSQAGLIDYQAKHKMVMTEEAIKEFEEDIKNGTNIDIKEYIKDDNKRYDNSISKGTLKVSNTISNSVGNIIKFFFKKLDKVMNN